jgi:hypothetical protein
MLLSLLVGLERVELLRILVRRGVFGGWELRGELG